MRYLIRDQVEILVIAGLIKKEDSDKAQNTLSNEYWKDLVAFTWSTNEILEKAKSSNKKLTRKQARKILLEMSKQQDPTKGFLRGLSEYYIETKLNS